MDLVRLGLERGRTAKEALTVVTNPLETHGQGGACAEDDPSFTYHNSYLIVDAKEAWVLETSGCHGVAKRMAKGVRNDSNCLSIRSNFDLSSKEIEDYARSKGHCEHSSDTPFDFMQGFCSGNVEKETSCNPRFCGGKRPLEKAFRERNNEQKCHDGHFVGSFLCFLHAWQTRNHFFLEDPKKIARHWMTGKPHPCRSNLTNKACLRKAQESLKGTMTTANTCSTLIWLQVHSINIRSFGEIRNHSRPGLIDS